MPRKRKLGTPLASRQREVLALMACGKTDVRIAFMLGVSPDTVKTHGLHIRQSLGLENRSGTAAKCAAMMSDAEKRAWCQTPAAQKFLHGLQRLDDFTRRLLAMLVDEPDASHSRLAFLLGEQKESVVREHLAILFNSCGDKLAGTATPIGIVFAWWVTEECRAAAREQ